MDKKNDSLLHFAVLGTGFWSTLQIPAWLEFDNVSCVAVWNRTYEKAVQIAKRFSISTVYKDAEELLKNEQLDFVDIITEVPAHEELVLLCAKYKVPVICQKPMSFSYESCEKMVKECKKAGIPFYIHENWKYRAPFVQLKDVLALNSVGSVRRVEFNETNGGRLAYAAQPFLKTLPHMILTDLGSHVFDLARLFFGEPESLYCCASKTYDDLVGENFAVVTLKYLDKLCTITIGERMDNILFIDGEEGSITMDNDFTITIQKDTGEKTTIKTPEVRRYSWAEHTKEYLPPDHVEDIVACNRTFLKAFLSNEEPENTAENNLKTMKLVYAACESAETGKPIRLKKYE
jgi:predicted dehydrogenase